MEVEGVMQKECNIFDEDGLLIEQYKTRVQTVPKGSIIPFSIGKIAGEAAALYRFFTYDDEGNKVGSVPRIREWTQVCEDAATGTIPPEGPVGGVPAGLKIANSEYEYSIANLVPAGATVTLATKTLLLDESIYLRHIQISGENRSRFIVDIDGSPKQSKRLWWMKFNDDFWFNTANGGILYQDEEIINVVVTNDGPDPATFEASIGFVTK